MNISFTAIKERVPGSLRFLAEHAFVLTLALIALALFISALLFAISLSASENTGDQGDLEVVRFRRDLFLSIVGTWNAQEEKFRQADALEVRELFQLPPGLAP